MGEFDPRSIDKYFSNVEVVKHLSCPAGRFVVWMVVDSCGNEAGRLSYYFGGNSQWDIYVDNFPSSKKYFSSNLPIKSVGQFFDDVSRTGLVLVPN